MEIGVDLEGESMGVDRNTEVEDTKGEEMRDRKNLRFRMEGLGKKKIHREGD